MVLLEDVGLDGAAHVSQHPGADLGGLRVVWLAAVLLGECPQPLADDGVEEHRQDGGAAVDRHRHRDVRPPVGVAAVEGHRVERGRQPGGVAAAGQQPEPPASRTTGP